jgi:hypothetical protein
LESDLIACLAFSQRLAEVRLPERKRTARIFGLPKKMEWLKTLAEQRIRQAMEQGEFNNLALKGRPLLLEDLTGVPQHLRVGYLILKNAGFLPPEMQLRKEIITLQDLMAACFDERERRQLKRELNDKLLRYRVLMKK